jgi:flagellar basal body rod protein FlgC
MSRFLLLFGLLFSVNVLASPNQECEQYKAWQIALALTGSNLMNIETTHTPDGGPYKPFDFECGPSTGCVLNEKAMSELANHPILRYRPDHPDAKSNGYVAFPRMEPRAEYASFDIIAKKLRAMKSQGVCENDAGAENDSFIFDRRDNVIAWTRLDATGTTEIKFSPAGDVLSARCR